jgi:cadmium resistance protein CadD (predicted permease)
VTDRTRDLITANADLGRMLEEKERLQEQLRQSQKMESITMSFGIYLVGYIILIAGLAIGANLLHVPMQWIGVGILCLIGLAIVHGVTATRQKDPQS